MVTNVLFLVMKTFKIYSFSNFQIYNTVLLTVVTMLYIISPQTYLSYNWKFVPFDHLHPMSPLLRLWKPLIWSLFLWVCFFHISHISEILQYLSFSVWKVKLQFQYKPNQVYALWLGKLLSVLLFSSIKWL